MPCEILATVETVLLLRHHDVITPCLRPAHAGICRYFGYVVSVCHYHHNPRNVCQCRPMPLDLPLLPALERRDLWPFDCDCCSISDQAAGSAIKIVYWMLIMLICWLWRVIEWLLRSSHTDTQGVMCAGIGIGTIGTYGSDCRLDCWIASPKVNLLIRLDWLVYQSLMAAA